MKGNQHKTIFISGLCLVLILVSVFSTTSTTYASSPSPFVGEWFATDWDASEMRLAIGGKPLGLFQITLTDSSISYCQGGPGIIRGKGWLNQENANLLEADMRLVCFRTGNILDFHSTWRYFPSTGMAVSGTEAGYIIIWHKSGPSTPPAPELYLRVNYNNPSGWVEGFYEAGHTVWVTITGSDGVSVKATAEMITEPLEALGGGEGFNFPLVNWSPSPPVIQPNDWVYGWVDNGATKKVQIGEINGSVDITDDSVHGNISAPWISAGVTVECHSWGAPLPQEIIVYDYDVLPDGNDTYTCSWVGEWDIQPGQVVGVSYFDPDGNWVANMLLPPWIRAHPEWNSVDAWFWPENKTLQLTIDDPNSAINPDVFMEMSGEIDPNVGTVWFNLSGYDLKTGDIVTMTDGIVSKVMTVSNLTISSVDVNSDIVDGYADEGDIVRLPNPGELFVFAGENGEWIADFASEGYDVLPGTWMIAEEYDIDWDTTSYEVWVPELTIGYSTVEVLRSDVCGNPKGWLCESLVGDTATDAMRNAYSSIGVEFAINNSGGFRAQLTCPAVGGGAGICPVYSPPPYQITRSQVSAVLSFGNKVHTLQVNGAELKAMLENGVSMMPFANGRFPQVSGLCFSYDIEAPVGSRVTSVVRQAADGSCTDAEIDLTDGTTYMIAENDYMSSGGDGYPDFTSRITVQNMMDQVLADYITANSPINPTIQGRIKCVDPNPGTGNDCPVGSP